MLYTGGTTGMPKGVMYSLREFTRFFLQSYPPMIGLAPVVDLDDPARRGAAAVRGGDAARRHVGPPVDARHRLLARDDGTASVRRHRRAARGRGLDPVEVWDAVEREGCSTSIVVGDAFAKPLLARPGRRYRRPLGPVVAAPDGLVGGHVLGARSSTACSTHMPALAIADVLGSTEGGMGTSIDHARTPLGTRPPSSR